MGNPEGGYTTQPMNMPQQQQSQDKRSGLTKFWGIIKKIFNAVIFGFGFTIGSKIANAIF
ncbi:hypothetical protein FOA43_002049 [Brettanomyces nanus]|uniref:Uncharacterized protein n=1 Tax=Eeniella nana TaxID=13502 RepID=A0A875RZX8_EENNA|nr:uncharacterized protein FOA43_002049 [Brettanomyces nanus]QPG74716.1 hypothetical protein FOA43_002049 [Brettanomyces nanus]